LHCALQCHTVGDCIVHCNIIPSDSKAAIQLVLCHRRWVNYHTVKLLVWL
jgi:hypothetical protein